MLICLLSSSAFIPLAIMQNGLDNPEPIGEFLNDSLPALTPSSSSSWEVEHMFPNLTFVDPVQMLEIPGTNRWMMAGKKGKIWTFEKDNNTLVKYTALDIESQVKTSGDEGLLGIVFHPEYHISGSPNEGYFYVFYRYTPDQSVNNLAYCRLSRFRMMANFIAPPDSEFVMINQYDRHAWHNGGGMFFGPDGFLYLTIGDEGGANDQYNSGQKMNLGLLAGVLRIDVDKDPTRSHPVIRQPQNPATPPSGWPNSYSQGYFIPNDNPWVDPSGNTLEEFYAIGLRSPHRMTYDAETGNIWIGDIGQGSREEVSIAFKGANMQWPYKEGDINGPKAMPNPLIGTDTPPIHAYPRSVGNCVIGGFVYRGSMWSASLYGKYIFGDHSQRKIWMLDYDEVNNTSTSTLLATVPAEGVGSKAGISHFSTDSLGNIYVLKLYGTNLDGGKIYRLKPTNPVPEPPPLLSETKVFQNTAAATLVPADWMIPYELNMPFWSDSALKSRWMVIPNDGTHNSSSEQIDYSENGAWQFPTGAVMVKHFEMPMDENNPGVTRRLETRFLVHANDGSYYGISYRWKDDQTDAELLSGPYVDTLSIATNKGPREIMWEYPSRSQCLSCHNNAAGGVLGPKSRQLNKDIFYPLTSRNANQLVTMEHLEMFSSNVDTSAAALAALLTSASMQDGSASLEDKARSYLDANCAYCHQPGNPIQASFDARLSTALADQQLLYGETHNSLGLSGMREIIPGDLEHSMLFKRISAVHRDYAMPPLAKNKLDGPGVELIEDWVNGISPNQTLNTPVVHTYADEFQGGPASPGWSYLWNSGGAIGNASNYSAMAWNGTYYDSDGINNGMPDPGNLAWGNLTSTGGHTGPSAGQGQTHNRYVIAAYTVSEAGNYSITNSSFVDANSGCGDGAELKVYVNNSLIIDTSFPNGGSTTFDGALGALSVGDVIYVAAGPGDNHDSCDGFSWNFSVQRITTITHQRIDFPQPPNKHSNDPPFQLAATASSGLPITYSILSGPANISGNTVTITGSGFVTIRAAQTGNVSYSTAPEVERTICVAPVGSGDGNGLLGTYFNQEDLTNIALIRTDDNIDFYWGSGSPDPGMEFNTYSVVWEGEIESPVSETMTFTATTDDGVKLYVNNQLIIDHWEDQGATGRTGSIAMTAWQRVPIRIEYYENGVYASARLEWASNSLPTEIVPSHFLYPASASSFPVELLTFEARAEDQRVMLDWSTASEYNSDFFQVERAIDGETYEKIEAVMAAGKSETVRNYQTMDLDPHRGSSYYRLKMVDLDGSYVYSEVKEVFVDWQEYRIFPNPLGTERQLFIEAKMLQPQLIQIQLSTADGKLLREFSHQMMGNEERIEMDLNGIPGGVYFVRMSDESQTKIRKILIK